jgi:uncharacterized delta-60 repeat protein
LLTKKHTVFTNFISMTTTKLILTTTALAFMSISFSQGLTLDSTFGTNGKVVTSFGSDESNLASLAIQSDGKIVACGSYYNGTINQIALSRYLANGNIDTSFGNNGTVLTPVGTYLENESNEVKVLNNGKILVAASNGISLSELDFDFAIVRYNSNGTLDSSFGTNGILLSDFNSVSNQAGSLQIQSDNKFIVAGAINGDAVSVNPNFAIARYNENGAKDTSFGLNGLVSVNFGAVSNNLLLSEDRLECMKIQSDGKILAAGFTSNISETTANFGIVRLNSDGSLDSSFGINGRIITSFGGDTVAYSIQILSDGKFIVCGNDYNDNDNNGNLAIAKYTANGILDTSYGIGGKAVTDFTTMSQIFSSELQNDDKLIVSGVALNTTADFVLFRFMANGSLDTSFGIGGRQTIDFGDDEGAMTSITQADGKIILGGGTYNGISADFTLLRFNEVGLDYEEFISDKSTFSVYPNPFTNTINLSLSLEQSEVVSADLFDCNGRKIQKLLQDKSFPFGKNTIEIQMPESLANGIYFVEVFNGTTNTTLKIIK